MSSLSIAQRGFDNLIDEFGTSITIKSVTARTEDAYGDITETTSETSTTGLVSPIDESIEHQKYGDLTNADIVCIVDADVTVNEKDIVVINSIEYYITGIHTYEIKGTTVCKELVLKRKD